MELNQHTYFTVTVLILQGTPKLRNQFEIRFEQDYYELIMQYLNEIPIFYSYLINLL